MLLFKKQKLLSSKFFSCKYVSKYFPKTQLYAQEMPTCEQISKFLRIWAVGTWCTTAGLHNEKYLLWRLKRIIYLNQCNLNSYKFFLFCVKGIQRMCAETVLITSLHSNALRQTVYFPALENSKMPSASSLSVRFLSTPLSFCFKSTVTWSNSRKEIGRRPTLRHQERCDVVALANFAKSRHVCKKTQMIRRGSRPDVVISPKQK